MISDEERRRVAKRMYDAADGTVWKGNSFCAMLARMTRTKEATRRGVIHRLADLIDRPMCHDLVEHKQDPFIPGKQMVDGYFHCSSCDWSGQLLEYIGFGGMLAYEPVHCPKCGEEIKR